VEEGHLDWQEVTPLRDVLIGAADARVTADDLVVAKLIDATPGVLALARAALKRERLSSIARICAMISSPTTSATSGWSSTFSCEPAS
jgi:hypothetical protein